MISLPTNSHTNYFLIEAPGSKLRTWILPIFCSMLDNRKPLPSLTDEGEAYAKRLNEEGTKITQLHYPNLFHAFVNFTKIPACKLASDDLILEMKAFL